MKVYLEYIFRFCGLEVFVLIILYCRYSMKVGGLCFNKISYKRGDELDWVCGF